MWLPAELAEEKGGAGGAGGLGAVPRGRMSASSGALAPAPVSWQGLRVLGLACVLGRRMKGSCSTRPPRPPPRPGGCSRAPAWRQSSPAPHRSGCERPAGAERPLGALTHPDAPMKPNPPVTRMCCGPFISVKVCLLMRGSPAGTWRLGAVRGGSTADLRGDQLALHTPTHTL